MGYCLTSVSLSTIIMVICQVHGSILDQLKYNTINKPKDCEDIWRSGVRSPGVYEITPDGQSTVKVYCAHTAVGSGTLIQRRSRGNTDFYRHWNDYKYGFGDMYSDHWAGLQTIHHLTAYGGMRLVISLQDWSYNHHTMYYDYMVVSDETYGYFLQIGRASGTGLLDDMAHSNNTRFATWDRPDPHACARNQKAGWWYNYCAFTLLNGVYYHGGWYQPTSQYYDGIYWKDWYGYNYSLKSVNMTLYRR